MEFSLYFFVFPFYFLTIEFSPTADVLVAIFPAIVIVSMTRLTILADFFYSSVHHFGTVQTQLEAIWRQ